MITTITYSTIYCYITFYSSGQYDEDNRFLKYFYTMTLVLFCTQSFASSVGIVLQKNTQFALFASIAIASLLLIFIDFLFKGEDMPIPLKVVSEVSFPKFMFGSIIIIIYGLHRCESHQIPYILRQFDIKDDERIFWDNSKRLMFILIGFKIFEFALLWLKSSRLSFGFHCINKLVNTKSNSNSNKSDNNDNYVVSIDRNEPKFPIFDHKSNEIMLAWCNLTCKVNKLNQDDIGILENLNGFITTGSLNAVMGPSGAGKTTLMKCLMSDKILVKSLDVDSKILVNWKALRKTCYLQQTDSQFLIRDLTVFQTMIYASQLKNSNESAKVDHQLIVNSLLNDLMISDVKHTKVGKCSGGQQKRVVIACELTAVVRPDLLCIDEPTTGLDSTSAQRVFKIL